MIVLITAVAFWLALNPQWVAATGRWGYVGAFLISLVASATIVLPAPGLAVIIAMSGALNPVVLALVAAVGGALGELTGYVAGASGARAGEGERGGEQQVAASHTALDGAIWRVDALCLFGLPRAPV